MTETLAAIADIVGRDNFSDDETERGYFSQDYFRQSAHTVAAVARPRSVENLARTVAAATRAGMAVYPRGAGYSYTDGYLPTGPGGLALDLRGLNKIVEINATDMYATVEAGCTWRALDEALAAHGLRVPFWGPLSGRYATIGGGVSQGAVSLGSSLYGSSAHSVLAMDVIAADGSIVSTGPEAQPGHNPFFRPYGPDLTGLFCADAGALGIKARITLRLIARPAFYDGVAYGFSDFAGVSAAMAAVARLNIASDSHGLSLAALRSATTTGGFLDDLNMVTKIIRSNPSLIGGLMQAARIAMAGRRFLGGLLEHSAHFTVEGHSRAEVAAKLKTVRAAAAQFGREMVNTVPLAMRADPFAEYDMLNGDGRRQLPFHGIFQFSRLDAFFKDYRALMAGERDAMARHGAGVLDVFSGISSNAVLCEPVLMWPDVADEFHRRHSRAPTLAKIKATEPQREARAYMAGLRDKIVDLMFAHGAVHLQIGKAYPYARERDPRQLALLRTIKTQMDPNRLINPGALGI